VRKVIKKELFVEIFLKSKDAAFFEEDVLNWHETARKAVVVSLCGESAYSELELLIKKAHWPVLKDIDNPKFDIYSKSCAENPALVKKFTNLIKKKKEIVAKKGKFSDYRKVIYDIVGCYPAIFDFDEGDEKYIKRNAPRYEKALIARISRKRNKKLAMVAALVGTGALLGFGAKKFIDHLIREKNNKNK
jgi:hypothetical protein